MRKRLSAFQKRLRIVLIFVLTLLAFLFVFYNNSNQIEKNSESEIINYISEIITPTSEFVIPPEFQQNVNFWTKIFKDTSIYSVVYYLPKNYLMIKQIDSSLDFAMENDGFVNIVLTSDGEEIAKYSIFDLLETNNSFNILSIEPVKEKIDTIYDALDKQLHDNNTLDEDEHIGYSRGRKEKFEEAWKRSGQFIEQIMTIFENNNVPKEVAYLAFTESAFDYNAKSSSNAVGIFQMIPSTARHYGLIVNRNIDERQDPLLEAHAASLYLHDLYLKFDHWLWAINAYHSGEKNLEKALNWAQSTYPDTPPDYDGTLSDYQYTKVVLEFPDDTIFNNGILKYKTQSAKYTTLFLAFLETKKYLEQSVSLDSPIEYKQLKVKYNKNYIEEKQIVIQAGDTLSALSYYYGVSVDKIMSWNNLTDSSIHPNDTLLIYVEEPPLTFKDIFKELELSEKKQQQFYNYNYSYTKQNMTLSEFANQKIYSNTTLNLPQHLYQDINILLLNY